MRAGQQLPVSDQNVTGALSAVGEVMLVVDFGLAQPLAFAGAAGKVCVHVANTDNQTRFCR